MVHRVPSPNSNVGRQSFTELGHVELKVAAVGPGEILVLLKNEGDVEYRQLAKKLDQARINRSRMFNIPRCEGADDALQLRQCSEVRQDSECEHLVRFLIAKVVVAQNHPRIEVLKVVKVRAAHVVN